MFAGGCRLPLPDLVITALKQRTHCGQLLHDCLCLKRAQGAWGVAGAACHVAQPPECVGFDHADEGTGAGLRPEGAVFASAQLCYN